MSEQLTVIFKQLLYAAIVVELGSVFVALTLYVRTLFHGTVMVSVGAWAVISWFITATALLVLWLIVEVMYEALEE